MLAILLAVIVARSLVVHGNRKLTGMVDILLVLFITILAILPVVIGLFLPVSTIPM
jgi:hypothetical protein